MAFEAAASLCPYDQGNPPLADDRSTRAALQPRLLNQRFLEHQLKLFLLDENSHDAVRRKARPDLFHPRAGVVYPAEQREHVDLLQPRTGSASFWRACRS